MCEIFDPMKSFQLRPLVRTTVSLPAGLERFAQKEARREHNGNLSAYFRGLLQSAWKSSQTPEPKNGNHEGQ